MDDTSPPRSNVRSPCCAGDVWLFPLGPTLFVFLRFFSNVLTGSVAMTTPTTSRWHSIAKQNNQNRVELRGGGLSENWNLLLLHYSDARFKPQWRRGLAMPWAGPEWLVIYMCTSMHRHSCTEFPLDTVCLLLPTNTPSHFIRKLRGNFLWTASAVRSRGCSSASTQERALFVSLTNQS